GMRSWRSPYESALAARRVLVRATRLPCAVVVVAASVAFAPVAGAAASLPVRAGPASPTHRGGRAVRRGRRSRSQRAHVAIVGGSQITIEPAPWQVKVEGLLHVGAEETVALRCGGSMLDETEVLTAAHCVFNPLNGERVAADKILVLAGAADFPVAEAEDQESLVSGVRFHPYYAYDPEAKRAIPDDVAVLKLEQSIAFGSSAKSIALASAGALAPEGTAVSLTGFGEQLPGENSNGHLYSLGMNLVFSRHCGGEADALFACASTPTGSLCSGDSGSGLTLPGSTATLIGVTDTVEVISGESCRDGALGGFANVAAPEIRDFIGGSESPPRAPRGGSTIVIRGVLLAGRSLTCEPGSWSNAPTFTYTFIDSSGGRSLQSGPSSTYALSAADVGRTILCEVQAANAGGTGAVRTEALPAIQAPAEPTGGSTGTLPGAIEPLPVKPQLGAEFW